MRSLVVSSTLLLALCGAAFAKGAPAAPTAMPMADVKWVDLMGPGGPQMAVLWGDPTKGGESGFLLKLPAGMVSPPHSHTNPYWAVTIQGSMSHWLAEGGSEADAKQLPAGGFEMMPGKVKHISKCAAGADCIMAVRMNGKFDFKAVEQPKAAAAPAAGKPADAKAAASPAPVPAPK